MLRQYTAEQRRELIDLVTAGRATIFEAAARLGVPPSTAYSWARRAAAQPLPPRKATWPPQSAERSELALDGACDLWHLSRAPTPRGRPPSRTVDAPSAHAALIGAGVELPWRHQVCPWYRVLPVELIPSLANRENFDRFRPPCQRRSWLCRHHAQMRHGQRPPRSRA